MPLFQNKSFCKPFHTCNYENEFDLLEIETEGRTHCPMNGFELRQTEVCKNASWIWPIYLNPETFLA